MGEAEGLRAILGSVLHPGRVYLTCRAEHPPAVGESYAWEGEPRSMWRMSLRRKDIPPGEKTCIRMTAGHAEQIRNLVAQEGISGFAAAQIDHGIFFGIYENELLVSVAGTHLVSPTYGVAAVGNIVTHPDFRGRGYATAAVSAVLSELAGIGIRDIVLNVQKENAPAIHIYQKLGFECYCEFLEGPASSRSIGPSHHSVP
jgi:ribosomal protein S18 acetylase RimI-like enzyme